MDANEVPMDETQTLISTDKVEGAEVYDSAGRSIGTIKTVMLNKLNGRVAYVVMESGGFLGLGADYYPIPWEALRYDQTLGGYHVNLDDFDNAPRYPADSEPNWLDGLFNADVRRYYGVPDATAT